MIFCYPFFTLLFATRQEIAGDQATQSNAGQILVKSSNARSISSADFSG